METEVMPLRPGDRVVVRLAERLNGRQLTQLRTVLEQEFHGHRVLLLEPGMELEIVRAEA